MFNLFKNFEWQLAKKFTKTGQSKKDKFVSFIAMLSMAGIALGVAALIIVISVMNGFQKDVRDKMLSVLSHIEIDSYNGDNWDITRNKLLANNTLKKDIQAVAPFMQGQAMGLLNGGMFGVAIRGIDPKFEPSVSKIMSNINPKNAKLEQGNFNVWMGKPLAQNLGLNVGDKFTLALPNSNVSPLGVSPRLKTVTIGAIFDSGHYEFDSGLLVMNLYDTQKLLMAEGISGVRVKLYDMHKAPFVANKIQQIFPDLIAKDWSHQNKTWFSAVQTEKRMMFLILSMLIAVAAFNLVSTLVMSVKDKQGNIAIMRTFGATSGSIRRIFIYQGLIIGISGTILGLIFGCIIAFNVTAIVDFLEKMFNTKFLPESIYLISSMPSDPRLSDIALIAGGSMLMTILATIYPSSRASKLYPANILRHE